jgi:hypothetical protein
MHLPEKEAAGPISLDPPPWRELLPQNGGLLSSTS